MDKATNAMKSNSSRRAVSMAGLLFIISSLFISPAGAQSWVKKAAKSVFTLKTFDAQGTLLGSAAGVFVGEGGEAVSSYAPFRGASSAVVIDAAGKEYPVEVILGASDTYDVAKFRVVARKTVPLSVAAQPVAEGTPVWLLPYREQKQARQGVVRRVETFAGQYEYLTTNLAPVEGGVGLPVLSAGGQLVALMQPAAPADTATYAVSARYADSLKMGGLSINDPALRAIHIRKALPAELSQAQLTLFVGAQSLDSAAYARLVDDFIQQFPQEQDGYITRAQLLADGGRYADADADMARAISVSSKKDEAHYSYARLIYQKLMYSPEPAYDAWTLDKALAESEAATAANPQPGYLQQQAHILYAKRQYDEASAIYDGLFGTPLRSPELFFEASRCRLALADTIGQLALLDSAVNCFSRPLLREAAPYLLERAQVRIDAGRFRDAVGDLNDYESLMAAQVSDQFYYLRFQAEQNGRLFQQALNDIDRAIQLNPTQETYYAEKASLQIRVGLYDDAIETARECIRLAPEYSDGHLFLGLGLCLKGQKAEGVSSLQRAQELGDDQAAGLIEKYGK